MMPLDGLEHDALETSTLSDRELLVRIHDAVRKQNGCLRDHQAELDQLRAWAKIMWAIQGATVVGVGTILGFLLEHVL